MLVTTRSGSAALAVAATRIRSNRRDIHLLFGCSFQKLQDCGLGLAHRFLARMRLAGPEEATQAVLFTSRHDVHMQMRNALADTIVDGDERSFGRHSVLDGASEQLDVGKERSEQLFWQVGQRLKVRLGNQYGVADEERLIIQERDRQIIFKHDVIGVRRDLAESATGASWH